MIKALYLPNDDCEIVNDLTGESVAHVYGMIGGVEPRIAVNLLVKFINEYHDLFDFTPSVRVLPNRPTKVLEGIDDTTLIGTPDQRPPDKR